MPELPEVEIVRTGLQREFVGLKIKSVAVTGAQPVRRHKKSIDFRALSEGRTIKAVQRLGMYLVAPLDNGSHLVLNLGPAGQLLAAKSAKEPKPKHTHIVLSFVGGTELRFVDPANAGEAFISLAPAPDAEIAISKYARLSVGGDGLALRAKVPELATVGLDPLEDQIGWDRFAAVLRSSTLPLRTLLTDQEILSGIGPMYADEILFSSNLRFDRPANSLSTIEIRRLHRTIPEVIADAIKAGGTSLKDDQFVTIDAKLGSYQSQLQVYEREGQPCVTCRAPIVKVMAQGSATYFCPKCQSA